MLKPNKRYSCHLDDEYLKIRDAKLSPWNFVKNNYIITTHFVKRIRQRKITINSVANSLQYGKKYYVPEEDSLLIKHVYENRGVIERDGKLITAVFFGKDRKAQESFIRSSEYFIFETE